MLEVEAKVLSLNAMENFKNCLAYLDVIKKTTSNKLMIISLKLK